MKLAVTRHMTGDLLWHNLLGLAVIGNIVELRFLTAPLAHGTLGATALHRSPARGWVASKRAMLTDQAPGQARRKLGKASEAGQGKANGNDIRTQASKRASKQTCKPANTQTMTN